MIMEDVCENAVTIGGDLQVGEFKIKASAKAFSILSNSLYKNKIRAIIRELSCNSRDSRVAAGLSEDFYVHLPTTYEPEFWVKDEGLGLSHTDVMNLYTTYFESTKSTSNQFVGALGLGSKSPFSYTENFTVTSIKDGIRGVYSAFIGETGVPSIVLLFSEETPEPNGVEVRMAVKNSDFNEFYNEACNVYQWFTVKPSCNKTLGTYNNTAIDAGIECDTIRFGQQSIVLMGGVAYEFYLADFIKNPVSLNFLFKFPIGSVDVLPSREGLQNTEKTKSVIIAEYNRILDVTRAKVKKNVDEIDTYYDRVVYLHPSVARDGQLVEHVKKEFLKSDYSEDVFISELENLNMCLYSWADRNGQKSPKKCNEYSVTPSKEHIFIYNDGGYSIAAIKSNISMEWGSRAFLFNKIDKKVDVDLDILQKEILLGAKLKLASDFVVIKKRVVASVSTKNVAGVLVATESSRANYYEKQYKLVPVKTLDNLSPTYYIRLDEKNKIIHKSGSEMYLNAITQFVGKNNIIFLKKSSKFDTTNMTDFFDFADAAVANLPKYFNNIRYNATNEFEQLVCRLTSMDSGAIHDTELVEFSADCKTAAVYCEDTVKFLRQTHVYTDPRIPLDSGLIKKLSDKYSCIYSSNVSDSMLESLINTIHNHKEI